MSGHHQKQSAAHSHDPAARKQPLHKDWRTWAVVGLMLVSMAAYILTMDESVEPDGAQQPGVPASP